MLCLQHCFSHWQQRIHIWCCDFELLFSLWARLFETNEGDVAPIQEHFNLSLPVATVDTAEPSHCGKSAASRGEGRTSLGDTVITVRRTYIHTRLHSSIGIATFQRGGGTFCSTS